MAAAFGYRISSCAARAWAASSPASSDHTNDASSPTLERAGCANTRSGPPLPGATRVQRLSGTRAARQVVMARIERYQHMVRAPEDLSPGEETEVARVRTVVAIIAKQKVVSRRHPHRAVVAAGGWQVSGKAHRMAHSAVAFDRVACRHLLVVANTADGGGRVVRGATVDVEHVATQGDLVAGQADHPFHQAFVCRCRID